MRFFHGTTRDAAEAILRNGFSLDAGQHRHDVGEFGLGIYLTLSPARARAHGEVVLAVTGDGTK